MSDLGCDRCSGCGRCTAWYWVVVLVGTVLFVANMRRVVVVVRVAVVGVLVVDVVGVVGVVVVLVAVVLVGVVGVLVVLVALVVVCVCPLANHGGAWWRHSRDRCHCCGCCASVSSSAPRGKLLRQ